MNKFDELLEGFHIEYFGTGQHKMGIEKALSMLAEDKVVILDVRTKEELAHLKFSFSMNIPLNELPERVGELPKDKTIAIFCVSGTRATIASVYLQVNGFKQVKIIPESLSEIAGVIKPGYVLNNGRV